MQTLKSELKLNLTVVRPRLSPVQIEAKYGKLWETDHELYGEITKVEPMNAAFDTGAQCFKILPILDWSKTQVNDYMQEMKLPRHPLQASGFATVGDAHSSRALKAGETNERATRFGGKSEECGLHAAVSLSVQQLLAQDSPLPNGYTIFSKPNCKKCRAAKALLDGLGLPYSEKDISDDDIAAELFRRVP